MFKPTIFREYDIRGIADTDLLDEDVRLLPVGAGELDLKESIREEVILSQTLLALCMPNCRGLCPQCGTNLNQQSCQCTVEEADPRWDVLRALKKERE